MIIVRRLKELRLEAHKTQCEIADELYTHVTIYRRYEKGTRDLPLWAAINLADYYNVSVDYLVGRTEIREMAGKKTYND